ncbi:hypothetical protein ISP18_12330 [Dyella humi]|uniref:Uncharacterized protein n=1 Tax=Dyella humi TaxID=1770547 RepID=A0ABW8IJJ4_9GAMM
MLAVAVVVGFSSAAWSAAPSTGLGQAWPNAADVSVSPHYHVYRFVLDGIQYIQVNDLGGTVHAAIAAANGTVLVLPIGVDAAKAKSAVAGTSATASSIAETVYQDATVSVSATPQSDGSVQVLATPKAAADTCSNPGECSNVVAKPQ